MGKRIFILYSEVMPYMVKVWEVLVRNHNCELHVVHWDVKRNTPYHFTDNIIKSYPRSAETSYSLKQKLNTIEPDILYVSGRMDKAYLRVAKEAKRLGLPVIMGSDKQWLGSWRDYLAVMLKEILYSPFFTHAWVPGPMQREYALRVGFSGDSILDNLYTGNVELFNSIYAKRSALESHDILFVGRLTEIKGIVTLVSVLRLLRAEGAFTGKLWVYGNGPQEHLLNEDWIVRKGFTSQFEFEEGITRCSIFCLPSIKEPWGVVLHEMAAAGMPIICSDVCGARHAFVKHNYNGFIFKSGDTESLREMLLKMLKMPKVLLQTFGHRSHILAQSITPESSAASLLSIIKV